MPSPNHTERANLASSQTLTQQEADPLQLEGFGTVTSRAVSDTTDSNSSVGTAATNTTADDRHLLHQLCQTFPTDVDVIQTAVMLDSTKESLRCPAFLPLIKGKDAHVGAHVSNFKVTMSFNRKLFNGSLSKHKLQKLRTILPLRGTKPKGPNQLTKRNLDFKYPINIAINNGATMDVIQVLASAAPEMLAQPEDIRYTHSLLIALQKQPKNHKLVRILLQFAPQLTAIKDHHGNTPLHWAIQRGPFCSLDVIQALYYGNPKAVLEANFHGETPLLLAQRNTLVPEDVASFLQWVSDENMCSQLLGPDAIPREATTSTDDCISLASAFSSDEELC